jgi:hypothetical protein
MERLYDQVLAIKPQARFRLAPEQANLIFAGG